MCIAQAISEKRNDFLSVRIHEESESSPNEWRNGEVKG